jgi:hypothetical protein
MVLILFFSKCHSNSIRTFKWRICSHLPEIHLSKLQADDEYVLNNEPYTKINRDNGEQMKVANLIKSNCLFECLKAVLMTQFYPFPVFCVHFVNSKFIHSYVKPSVRKEFRRLQSSVLKQSRTFYLANKTHVVNYITESIKLQSCSFFDEF